MKTTAEDKNSSTESVVFLNYSKTVSFEEVEVEEFEQTTMDDFDKAADVTNETYESTEDENIKLVEIYESSEATEIINLSTEHMESAESMSIEELKHFTSPTPLIQPGMDSYNSDNSSWSDAIEAFLDQLNDIDFDSDYERDILLKRGLNESGEVNFEDQDDAEDTEEMIINELRTGQGFLLCLAVPVLLSQILMLLILTSTTSNAKSNIIVRPIGQIQSIHYHHYYEPKGESGNGFAYILFNPFGAIYNCRYFKITAAWISKEYRKQLNDPSSFISKLSHYISVYLDSCKSRVLKLNNMIKLGLDNEIGEALRIRDNWNRAVYDKIYKIASTPQYQHVVSTVSKWASAIKDRLFS